MFPDIDFGMLGGRTTGHYPGQGSGSGPPEENEVTGLAAGCDGICEQISVPGLPQANILETDAPTAVAQQPGKRKKTSKEYSKANREKNKKRKQEMQDELVQLRKNNEEYIKKLDALHGEVRSANATAVFYRKAYGEQQTKVNYLTKKLKNMTDLEEENRRLKVDNDLLKQKHNADSGGEKKWVKIPLENRKVKIKGNVLHLKMD
ncbi:hypothetical protein DITRI_Ditri12bG0092200 [Diplodiscus trichospermus]